MSICEKPKADYIEIQGVRIFPSQITFTDAFEYRAYKDKITIINCGKKSAFIRIMCPSSRLFNIATLEKGKYISPGLKIERIISYTYTKYDMVDECILPILVNGTEAIVTIKVLYSKHKLMLTPDYLDFGNINIDDSSQTLSVYLTNNGSLPAHVAVDGKNPNFQVMFLPNRCNLTAMQTQRIEVRVIGSYTGEFEEFFYFRTQQPLRLTIRCTFIKPEILVKDVYETSDFKVITFPRTYFGAKEERFMLTTNKSAKSALFCIMGRYNKKLYNLSDAKKSNITTSFLHFDAGIKEGTIYANEASILKFLYTPVFDEKNRDKKVESHVTMLQFNIVNWQDVTQLEAESDTISLQTAGSFCSSMKLAYGNQTSLTIEPVNIMITSPFENEFKIFLHGTAEHPNVGVNPYEVIINANIALKEKQSRVLKLTNHSLDLPITVEYLKMAFIDIQPVSFNLEPKQSKEITLKIQPYSLGDKQLDILFDLHYVQPHKKTKVGSISVPLTYCCIMPSQTNLNNYQKFITRKAKTTTLQSCCDQEISLQTPICKSIPNISVPLTPIQLQYIHITPERKSVGFVVQLSTLTETITVNNNNNFPIDISVRKHLSYVQFIGKVRKIIPAHSTETFIVSFTTLKGEGFFEIHVNVIVNDSAMFKVSFNGEIVLRKLSISETCFSFSETAPNPQYLDIFNPFSASQSFTLECIEEGFSIEPAMGVVEAHKHLLCLIMYHPNEQSNSETELNLNTDGKLTYVIKLITSKPTFKVGFIPQSLDLGKISYNMLITKVVAIKNYANTPYKCELVENVHEGVDLILFGDILYGEGQINLQLALQLCTIGHFSFSVKVLIQKTKTISMKVTGTVIMPTLVITPNVLKFRTITNHSCDRVMFMIKNVEEVDALVEFTSIDQFVVSESPNSLKQVSKMLIPQKSSKTYCLHFLPIDVTVHSFVLGISINGVHSDNFGKEKFPKPINNVKVSAHVQGHCISFSKSYFKFKYYPHPDYDNQISNTLIITNDGAKTEQFCLRWDELLGSFSITCTAQIDVERSGTTISAALKPGESVSLLIQWQNPLPGTNEYSIPVYVRGQSNGAIYNTLRVYTKYPAATMKVKKPVVYLEPVPLNTISKTNIVLTTMYHYYICPFYFEVHNSDLELICDEKKVIDPRLIENNFNLTITFSATSPKAIESKIRIYCKCGSQCFFIVKACSENCNMTTHAFLTLYCGKTIGVYTTKEKKTTEVDDHFDLDTLSMDDVANIVKVAINENESAFPYFPKYSDTSEYAVHMRTTLKTIEVWMNQQGFYGSKYYSIPHGMAQEIDDKTKLTPEQFLDNLPYIVLLRNLAGAALIRQFFIRIKPSPIREKIVENIWTVYKSIIQLLSNSNAFLPNIEPEYLLTYEQYTIFYKTIYPNLENRETSAFLNFQDFLALSTQNWLDILLQTYKVFQLAKENTTGSAERHPDEVLSFYAKEHMMLITGSQTSFFENTLYHPVENMLLYWMENVYNANKNIVSNQTLPEKCLKLFDMDLCDGIVLAVVVGAYCPYIRKDYKDFYWTIDSHNEALYNASKFCMIMEKLQCFITIEPMDIVHVNSLKMITFVMNLYDFLPSMWPNESLDFVVPLACEKTQTISISNDNNFPLMFTLVFFENDHNCFSTSKNKLLIAPKKVGTVEVIFKAKWFENVNAYLVFSGESKGFHLARNKVFLLTGTPQYELNEKMIIKIKRKTSGKFTYLKELATPYKEKADYNIYILYAEPQLNNIEMIAWNDIKVTHKIPRRVCIVNDSLVCNEKGVGNLYLILYCIWLSKYKCWLFFRNEIVGEFFVEIRVHCKDNLSIGNVQLGISRMILSSDCICNRKVNESCKKIIKLQIPAPHVDGWSKFVEALLDSLEDERDKIFWNVHNNTLTGMALLKDMLANYPMKNFCDFQEILNFPTQYEISIINNENVTALPLTKFYEIEDRILEITFHVNENVTPETLIFTLTSYQTNITKEYHCEFILCD